MSGGHAKWLCSPAVAPCCSLHLFKHNRRATLPPPTSAAGTSALTALTELFSLIRLHTCLTRIWNMMMPRPGGRQNGQGPCMSYVLPGCGGVALAEIGVAHLVLVVSPPPSSGDVLSAAPVPPLRITMRWVGRYADDAPQATVALTASSNGNTTPQQQKQKQQQQHKAHPRAEQQQQRQPQPLGQQTQQHARGNGGGTTAATASRTLPDSAQRLRIPQQQQGNGTGEGGQRITSQQQQLKKRPLDASSLKPPTQG